MFCPSARLHVLLNSSETVLGMIQYSTSNFSQLKTNFLMLKYMPNKTNYIKETFAMTKLSFKS